MGTLALGAQLLLASVFAAAGVAKLIDRPGSRRALVEFGLPERFAGLGGVVLPVAELLIAATLVASQSARAGAIAALALLALFITAIIRAMARGEAPDCHCFGQVHSAPAGRGTLARNAVLAAVATFIAVRGPGPALDTWAEARSAAELAATGAGLAALLLAVGSLRLRQENRRLRRDLETARAASALFPPGLPVGTRAPGFSLPGLRGETLTLDALRGHGRPVALVFADPSCGPCRQLLPELGRWQATLVDRITIVVVSTGRPRENRPLAQEHGLADVLLQNDSEVMDAYRVQATPSAVIVSPDGYLASAPAAGEFEIEQLVRLTLRRGVEAYASDEAFD